jgi:hypothetical protein
MTPLAKRIISQQKLLPAARRPPFKNSDGFLSRLNDFHCFETTEIEPLRADLLNQLARMRQQNNHHEIQKLIFLPAPRTWLEREAFGFRFGYLLDEWEDQTGFDLYGAVDTGASMIGKIHKSDPFGIIPANEQSLRDFDPETGASYTAGHCGDVVSQIILINSPHIIGRRQRMPNWSLERKLTSKMGRGKFPLHAWTEIKLEVGKPIEIDDGEPHEAHLTGKRALHFCRAHVRIKQGRLEYVKSHWRGDPAIGIKQSRYKMAAAI